MADDLIRVDPEGAASHAQAAVRLSAKGAVLLAGAAVLAADDLPAMPLSRSPDLLAGSPVNSAA